MRGQSIRYPASRPLLIAGISGLALAAFSAAVSLTWAPAWIASAVLALSALAALLLGLVPAVEIGDTHLIQSRRRIPWDEICQVRTLADIPLIVRLQLANHEETLVIHAGGRDSREALLHDIRLMARSANIDGVPYREFWGVPAEERPRARPLLLAEDEAEVERLFHQLKSVGHLEPNSPPEDE